MAKSESDGLDLDKLAPLIARTLAKKAFAAIEPILDETPEDLVQELFELLTVELVRKVHEIDGAALLAVIENLPTLSEMAIGYEKGEFDPNIVEKHLPKKLSKELDKILDKFGDPKAALASLLLFQLLFLRGVEDGLLNEASALGAAVILQRLEPSVFHVQTLFSFLKTFDDEVVKINRYRQLKEANKKRVEKFREIHEAFIAFWDSNLEFTNKTKAAEDFYRALTKEKQKRYQSEGKAVRQLTEVLREYLKEHPEKEHRKATRTS